MQANNRIDMVDALRGYALLGLFMVHCVERFELYWLDPMPDAWFDATMAVFAGKAFAIFALLFGFSFATIMANERTRGGDAQPQPAARGSVREHRSALQHHADEEQPGDLHHAAGLQIERPFRRHARPGIAGQRLAERAGRLRGEAAVEEEPGRRHGPGRALGRLPGARQ